MREDWKECCFEDLLDYEQPTNYIVKSTAYNDAYETPVLTAGKSFIKGYTNETEGIFDNLPTIIFDDFTTASQFVNFKFKVKSSAMKILVPTSELVNMDFAYYAMQVNQIRSDTHKRYWISVYAKKKFLLPSAVEQEAIVSKIEELFSDLDKGIADLKKAQDQLVIFRQAVLKKAFEGELTKEWREKQTNLPTAEELLEQIKEERQKHYEQQIEDWKQAVKTWEEKGKEGKKPAKPQKHKDVDPLSNNELDELASLPTNWKWIKNNELMFYVTSGSRDWKKFYSDTKGTYFVRTGDIKTNKLDLDGAAFVDLPKNVEGKRSLIEKGDLLMTITGANVGKIAHVDFEISEAYVSQSVALLKYVLKSFSPYLHYYFQSSATGAKFIGAMVYGVGRPVLSLDNMRDAPVSVCSFEEQHQIVQEIESRLSVCDNVEQSITESLKKAKALRQSILKKAFEGTLLSEEELSACKAAKDYEPASVLLKKIKAEKKK